MSLPLPDEEPDAAAVEVLPLCVFGLFELEPHAATNSATSGTITAILSLATPRTYSPANERALRLA